MKQLRIAPYYRHLILEVHHDVAGADTMQVYLILEVLHDVAGAVINSWEEFCALLYLESFGLLCLLGGDGAAPVVPVHVANIARQG